MILISFVASDLNDWCPTLKEEYKCSVCGNMGMRKITKLKTKA
jgi:hypothetical protein